MQTISQADFDLLQQGDVDLTQRRYALAIEAYERVLAHDVQHGNIYCNLAAAYQATGQTDLAEQAYRQGLDFDDTHVRLLSNFGIFLTHQFKFEKAEFYARQAVIIDPDFAAAQLNLAILLSQTLRVDEAAPHYQAAAQLDPNASATAAALLFNINYLPQTSRADIAQQAAKVGQIYAQHITPFDQWPALHNPRPAVLKIGFLSGDLCAHPVGAFLADVLRQLDKNAFEWHAFSCHDQHDHVSEVLRANVNTWHSLSPLSDAQAADLIRDQQIHILIDLSGHVHRNRMGIMAYKPAPIQASWLGWFCTTGMPSMDYFISDPISTPHGFDDGFSEQLYRLPHTRLCLSRPTISDAISPCPALKNGYITFGCMQNASKINQAVLQQWAVILNAIPDAQLRIQNSPFNHERLRDIFLQRAAAAGLDTTRITLLPFTNWHDYMRDYAQIDILLDTHPYTGGTTTAEALWMGVPTVTMTGHTMIANQGASLMTAAGLKDWVTDSPELYIQKAINWSQQIDELSYLRQGLREHVAHSPLFQAESFARHFEQALHHFWAKKCQ